MGDSASLPTTELVITVPEPFGASFAEETGTRTTLGVLIQLVVEAQRRVVLAAPFLQVDRGLSDPRLNDAIRSALRRKVVVNVVSTAPGLRTLDVEGLGEDARPWLRFYQPQANMIRSRALGSHAKFCLSDDEAAYVGSANLTGPALDGQLEMGVLVRGKVARQVATFWAYCVRNRVFVPVEPGSLGPGGLD